MSRPWKPGDVGAIDTRPAGDRRVIFTGSSWVSALGASLNPYLVPRPLVVIDPEDTDHVAALLKALIDHAGDPGVSAYLGDMKYAHAQAALRSLVTDPRPDEPQGLGAVVEDAEGLNWVRVAGGRYGWVLANMMSQFEVDEFDGTLYDSIAAVRVLSAGWSE